MDLVILLDYLLVVIVAFLIGSIPCGLLIGKFFYKSDPRTGGSGNIGATNMNRLYGWKAFAVTFVLDALKGILAVVFARIVLGFMPYTMYWQPHLLIVLSVLFAIVGHVFCPWLGFRGGKGISTGFGALLAAYPFVAVSILVTFLAGAVVSKRISVGSILGAIGVPVYSFLFYRSNTPLLIVGIVIMLAVVFAHRDNIKRIFAGTEPTFSFRKSKAKEEALEKELEDEFEDGELR